MSRPTTRPRLSQIDPAAVGREVEQALVSSYAQARAAVLPAVAAAHALATYARDGVSPGRSVGELLGEIAPLWRAPMRGARAPEVEVDPLTGLGLAVLGALGREAIDEGYRIPLRGLAVLGGVHLEYLRQLGRRGDILVVDGAVRARDARMWLASRGVAGYGEDGC